MIRATIAMASNGLWQPVIVDESNGLITDIPMGYISPEEAQSMADYIKGLNDKHSIPIPSPTENKVVF